MITGHEIVQRNNKAKVRNQNETHHPGRKLHPRQMNPKNSWKMGSSGNGA